MKALLASAALVAAIGFGGSAALATGTFGPITITACTAANNNGTVAPNSLEIKYFNNTAQRHIVSVTFAIRYNGVWQFVTDNGSFNPSAPIDHKFNYFAGVPWQGPNPGICRVRSATFADGQTYNGPR